MGDMMYIIDIDRCEQNNLPYLVADFERKIDDIVKNACEKLDRLADEHKPKPQPIKAVVITGQKNIDYDEIFRQYNASLQNAPYNPYAHHGQNNYRRVTFSDSLLGNIF